jgi:hypothetical protein
MFQLTGYGEWTSFVQDVACTLFNFNRINSEITFFSLTNSQSNIYKND